MTDQGAVATRWRRADQYPWEAVRYRAPHINGKARSRYLMMLGPGAVAVIQAMRGRASAQAHVLRTTSPPTASRRWPQDGCT